MNTLKNKVVVITGASSGIGRATAVMLAHCGAKVVLGARRADRLEALCSSITSTGGEAIYGITDVKKREDVFNLVNMAIEKFGKLDVLINNAGIGAISPLDAGRVEEWEDMIDINIKGVLYGIAAALPIFRKQGFGHFINTASTSGLIVKPAMAVYAGSKFAVRAISEGLRQEAGDKIRVTIITPGFIATEFTDYIPDENVRKSITEARDKFAISPDAIARAMIFAMEQPADVDVNEMIVRPTAQGG